MDKNKILTCLYWGSTIHTAFAIIWFLTIPTLQLVYGGVPIFWWTWDNNRQAALSIYITINGIITFISSVMRYAK